MRAAPLSAWHRRHLPHSRGGTTRGEPYSAISHTRVPDHSSPGSKRTSHTTIECTPLPPFPPPLPPAPHRGAKLAPRGMTAVAQHTPTHCRGTWRRCRCKKVELGLH